MLNVSRDNRAEIENEFMALVLNKNELLDVIQIKPEHLCDKRNQVILEKAMECYQKYQFVNPAQMSGKNSIDFDWYLNLLVNTFFYQRNWKEQMKISEESIVKFFKEDVIKTINEQLKNHEIDYEYFMKQMKKLDDIQLIDQMTTLTTKEILENIDTNSVAINFNHFPHLNNMLKLCRGDFLIIGATTGQGKSGFMLNLMNDLMTGFQCIYFNMEMSKSTIYKRLISINAEIPIENVLKPTNYQKKIIDESLKMIENAGLIVEHKANDIKQIKSAIVKLKDKDKHTILFVDHLGLCRCDDKKTLYEQATEVAKQLRQICLEYDCTIISASQLNRSAYNSDELSLSMLKDSGELENSASKVILLYRDKDCAKENPVADMNIEIVKNRDGITGIIKMKYDKTKQVFMEEVSKW